MINRHPALNSPSSPRHHPRLIHKHNDRRSAPPKGPTPRTPSSASRFPLLVNIRQHLDLGFILRDMSTPEKPEPAKPDKSESNPPENRPKPP